MTNTNENVDQSSTISETLAQFASSARFEAIPSEVIDYALLCIADSIGIAFASHQFSFADSGIATMQALGIAGR